MIAWQKLTCNFFSRANDYNGGYGGGGGHSSFGGGQSHYGGGFGGHYSEDGDYARS